MNDSARRQLQATAWLAVVHAYHACHRRYARLLGYFELTVPQYDVLDAIFRLGDDATPKAIAAELVVTRGNVTGVLQRLQERGWLQTRVNEHDGRSFVCELTVAGRRRLRRARAAAAEFIDAQLAVFDDAALLATRDQMTAMRAHLRGIDPEEIVARSQMRDAAPAGASR